MSPTNVPNFVRADLARLEIDVAHGVLEKLGIYLDLLLETNRRINLTGIRDREQAWRRHVIDSLTLLPGLKQLTAGSRVIDVGSGGGLPGVPLAVAMPHLTVALLEAVGKKARFLERCRTELALGNVHVVHCRAEEAGQDKRHRQQYDVAVCRAIGPMRELLEYTLPLVRVSGRVLAMKGPRVEQELEEAGDALAQLGAGEFAVFEAYPEEFGIHTVIVSILKAQPSPKLYPRRPGVVHQSPL